MWHRGKHQRSWFQKHALDIGTFFGLMAVLGMPVWLWMAGVV